MGTDNSTTIPAAPARHDVSNALLNLGGAIRLSREAVSVEMGVNETLVAAEGVLALAQNEVERILAMIDSPAVAKAWRDSIEEEVAHG